MACDAGLGPQAESAAQSIEVGCTVVLWVSPGDVSQLGQSRALAFERRWNTLPRASLCFCSTPQALSP